MSDDKEIKDQEDASLTTEVQEEAEAADKTTADDEANGETNAEKTDANAEAEAEADSDSESKKSFPSSSLFKRSKKKSYEFKPENPDAVDAAVKRLEEGMSQENITPQMERMMKHQEDHMKRVDKAIEDTKTNPAWFVPLFSFLLILGLLWVVIYYLTTSYPIPAIGAWNLAIGAGISFLGFILLMWWH